MIIIFNNKFLNLQLYNYKPKVMSVKPISNGQIKEIYNRIYPKFTLVNLGTHFIITDNTTNETTSYTYDSNFVFLSFCKEIRIQYLMMISENMNYFNWKRYGFDVVTSREDYMNRIIKKIIELCCGFKNK